MTTTTPATIAPAELEEAASVEIEPTTGGPSLAVALGWLLTVLGFYIGSRTIRDNSFLTHLTTGDLIRFRGSVPTGDPYSYTAFGETWTVQSWLASLWYSYLGDIGGGSAIRLGNGLLTAIVANLAWRLSSKSPVVLLRVAVVGMTIMIGATTWTPRPLLFGLVGIGLVMMVLEDRLDARWLIPIMWVWVNTHGSFPLGLVLIGAVGLGSTIDRKSLPIPELRVFGWATLGVLGGAINPLGFRLLTFPVELLSKREALEGVTEWLTPDFDSNFERLFLVVVFGLIIAARARAPWRDLVPAMIFALAGFLAVRNIAVASLVAILALTPAWKPSVRVLTGDERSILSRGVTALAVAGLLLAGVLLTRTSHLGLERYPVEQTDWLAERELIANPDVNVIHRDFVGNYMHWRFGLEARVFVDDRFDFYPQDLLDDHHSLLFGGDFAEILERRDADVILWRTEGPLAEWLRASDDWDIQQEDEDWLVALPR